MAESDYEHVKIALAVVGFVVALFVQGRSAEYMKSHLKRVGEFENVTKSLRPEGNAMQINGAAVIKYLKLTGDWSVPFIFWAALLATFAFGLYAGSKIIA